MKASACLLAMLLTAAFRLDAAGNELTAAVYQLINQYYQASGPRRVNRRLPLEVKVESFKAEETYRGENIGILVTEIVLRYLKEEDRIRLAPFLAQSGESSGSEALENEAVKNWPSRVIIAGRVQREQENYNIQILFYDARRGEEVDARDISIPADRFRKLLGRYYRWKYQIWTFQPYLQALYTEGYRTSWFPSTVIHNRYSASGDSISASDSLSVKIHQVTIDENTEMTAGVRLIYYRRLMMDLAYVLHGYSTESSQINAMMVNLRDPDYKALMGLNTSMSALVGTINYMFPIYKELRGYVGAGGERAFIAHRLSPASRLWFSGQGLSSIEVKACYLDGQRQSLAAGGRMDQIINSPLVRLGLEWRPRRFGFNFLAQYRMGHCRADPLFMAIEEIYKYPTLPDLAFGRTSIPVYQYRLPRISIGAAFTLSL